MLFHYYCTKFGGFQKEAVMTEPGRYFKEVGAGYHRRPFPALMRGKNGICIYCNHRGPGLDAPEGMFYPAAATPHVMAVHGVAKSIVAVCVKVPSHQFLPLVTLVGRHFPCKQGIGIILCLSESVTLEAAVGDKRLGAGALETRRQGTWPRGRTCLPPGPSSGLPRWRQGRGRCAAPWQ